MKALETDLARARLNATEARKAGDRESAVYWTEQAEDYELRLRLRDNPWDELAGSPDHSHAYLEGVNGPELFRPDGA